MEKYHPIKKIIEGKFSWKEDLRKTDNACFYLFTLLTTWHGVDYDKITEDVKKGHTKYVEKYWADYNKSQNLEKHLISGDSK